MFDRGLGLGAGLMVMALAAAGPASGADLTVEVVGLGSEAGNVHFALYDNPATFPDDEGRIRGTNVPIAGGRAVAVFKNLTPGSYAVAVFHDENGNGSFDQGFLGLPLEDYGFSNGAPAFLGPPSFDQAKISVPEKGIRITIDIEGEKIKVQVNGLTDMREKLRRIYRRKVLRLPAGTS